MTHQGDRAPRVLHLNGPPGVGKSTLARRWALEHPDTLLLEIDQLRTWVSGWSRTFEDLGGRIRSVALSMIRSYVETGYDVVVPQLVAELDELRRFQRAAADGGASYALVFLEADPHDLAVRVAERPVDRPWSEALHRLIADAEGHVERYRRRLVELSGHVPEARSIVTATGDEDGAYDALLAVLSEG